MTCVEMGRARGLPATPSVWRHEPLAELVGGLLIALVGGLRRDGKRKPRVAVAESRLRGLDVHLVEHRRRRVGSAQVVEAESWDPVFSIAGSHTRRRQFEYASGRARPALGEKRVSVAAVSCCFVMCAASRSASCCGIGGGTQVTCDVELLRA